MFRNEYIAKIGFTRTLDRTCGQCGGLYASNEKSHCPKCNQDLIIPTRQTDEGPRPYCFTEVTLYPMMRQETKDSHAKRTAAAKGLLYIIRMVLWGHYDKERNVVLPDNRVPYLVPKRTIRATFNNPHQLLPFTAKDGSQKIEMKYTFDGRDGDQIEFLDAKQTAQAEMDGAKSPIPTPEPVMAPTTDMVALATQITAQVLQQLGAVKTGSTLPAPNPANAGMSEATASDYVPDAETIAAEVITDPFAAE